MSHAQPEGVYIQGDFSEPMSAQHEFTNHYDLDDPSRSISQYARIMLQHTKNQLEMATSSARRRSQGFETDSTRTNSISSTDS